MASGPGIPLVDELGGAVGLWDPRGLDEKRAGAKQAIGELGQMQGTMWGQRQNELKNAMAFFKPANDMFGQMYGQSVNMSGMFPGLPGSGGGSPGPVGGGGGPGIPGDIFKPNIPGVGDAASNGSSGIPGVGGPRTDPSADRAAARAEADRRQQEWLRKQRDPGVVR